MEEIQGRLELDCDKWGNADTAALMKEQAAAMQLICEFDQVSSDSLQHSAGSRACNCTVHCGHSGER